MTRVNQPKIKDVNITFESVEDEEKVETRENEVGVLREGKESFS